MRALILGLTACWFIVVLLNVTRIHPALFIFILGAALERFWETFVASKQKILDKKSEFDWLFRIISYYYILMMFTTVLEYLYLPKKIIPAYSIIGGLLFGIALFVRLWAIRSLGGNWNTCVLGKVRRRFKPRRLVKKGLYRVIRHPIYMGTILESLAIPLIFNSYFTLLFAALVYTPLLILRAKLEEKEMARIFGSGYKNYKATTI